MTYGRLLRRWPALFALSVVGGVVGLLLAGALSTAYQATAQVTIGADMARSIWLDEDAKNAVMFRVQSLLLSDQTLDRALGMLALDLASQALPADVTSLRDQLNLTRIESSWQLSARAKSPSVAAGLANAWAEAAIEETQTAVEAATKAGQLQVLLFDVSCAPMEVPVAGAELWACDQARPAGSPADLPEQLLNAAVDSHGLVPPMSYSFDQRAAAPDKPIASAQAIMAAAGLLVGLLVGTLWVVAWPVSSETGAAAS